MKTNQAQRAQAGGGVGMQRTAIPRKKKKGAEVKREISDFEEVEMTEAQVTKMQLWLRNEALNRGLKGILPSKLNHAFLRLMVQLPKVLEMTPAMVIKFTRFTRQQLWKLRPHVNPDDDVQLSLCTVFKWCVALTLDPSKVMSWLVGHA